MLLPCNLITCDHGPQVLSKTPEPNHHEVDEHKEYEHGCDTKMKCARRLMTAEGRHQCGDNRHERGRHGKARPNNKREEKENYNQIRDLLYDIVGREFSI